MRCLRCFFAFLTAAVCAVLLYCLYLKAPNPLTRTLAPHNGSPWELGKLTYWSMLPAALTLHHLEPGSSRSGLCAAVLLAAVLPAALAPLTEALARNVHEVWAATRIAQGWRFGPERNDARKEHPCLIPYEELPEEERTYDRQTALETLKLIEHLGFEFRKR